MLLGLFGAAATPAGAAPAPAPTTSGDVDGTPKTPMGKLEAAARAYVEAKQRLDASRHRQTQLAEQLKTTEQTLAVLKVEATAVVAGAFKGNQFNVTNVLFNSESAPTTVLHEAATVQYMVSRDDRALREYVAAQKAYGEQSRALAEEIKTQEQQVAALATAKANAERALGDSSPTGGFGNLPATAVPAPRNPNGSWPKEACSVQDPTTSGCLTPRTLHMLQQARAAGFTRFTGCYRGGSWGEHPVGRACDFAAFPNGFVDARAGGADKEYGDRLAAWCVANADRLGVLYCIWYGKIWMAGTGWRTYSSDGSPAGGHYNHDHVSMY